MTENIFWITSRAAGTAAIVLASVSVGVGLAMRGRLGRLIGRDRMRIHETLSLSVMLAIALHGISLLGDSWLHPTLAAITIPLAISYRTLPVAIGIVSGWAMIVLGLAYYVRGRIGVKRWRSLHRFTALAWIGGLIHTFTTGTDAVRPWFIALVLLTAAPALILLIVRHMSRAAPSPEKLSLAAPRPT